MSSLTGALQRGQTCTMSLLRYGRPFLPIPRRPQVAGDAPADRADRAGTGGGDRPITLTIGSSRPCVKGRFAATLGRFNATSSTRFGRARLPAEPSFRAWFGGEPRPPAKRGNRRPAEDVARSRGRPHPLPHPDQGIRQARPGVAAQQQAARGPPGRRPEASGPLSLDVRFARFHVSQPEQPRRPGRPAPGLSKRRSSGSSPAWPTSS
jgi:hypothetical protein